MPIRDRNVFPAILPSKKERVTGTEKMLLRNIVFV